MDFENLELTVEDMLQLHREWITKLYVEEGKTEMEIVELLQERHLFVGYNNSDINTSIFSLLTLPQAFTSSKLYSGLGPRSSYVYKLAS